MFFIIDLILIFILVISVFLAAKKGLIKSLFSLLGTFLAITLSIFLSTPITNFVDENFVNPMVKKYVLNVVDNRVSDKNYDQALESADVVAQIQKMPEKLKEVIEFSGLDSDELIDKANRIDENLVSSKDELISIIADPVSYSLSRVITMSVLFALLNVALWFVSRFISALFNSFSLGKKLNKTGGIIFGFIRGLLIIWVICILFSAATKTVDPESNNIFSEKTIDSTFVLKHIMSLNPLDFILQ